MRAWLVHHTLSLAQTLRRLAAAPLATLLNVLVIGVALALPLGAWCLFASLQGIAGDLPAEPQLTLFLAPDAGKADIAAIEARLRQTAGVGDFRFVGKEAALAGLKRDPAFAEVIATLKDNPLPDAFVVRVAGNSAVSSRLEQELARLPKVAQIQAEAVWVSRLEAFLHVGRAGVVLLAGLLGFSLMAVTFNTIRLQIVTHRDEIDVSRLVGATDAYVRRPFYYLGAVQAFLGGTVALAVVWGAVALLNVQVAPLAQSYGSAFRFSYPGGAVALAVLASAAALGWLGAHLSVSVHLREKPYQ